MAQANATDVFAAQIKLMELSGAGDLAGVKALLADGVDANAKSADGTTALMVAAAAGHKEVVQTLLAAKSDVNASRKDNSATALAVASQNGHLDVVLALIAAGANINYALDNGDTALIRASRNGYLDIVQALITAKAKINMHNLQGNTALIVASGKGQLAASRALLAAGADVNAKANDRATALPVAFLNEHDHAINHALLTVNAKANESATALSVALLNAHPDVAKLLRDAHGANAPKSTRLPDPPAGTEEVVAPEGHHAYMVSFGEGIDYYLPIGTLGEKRGLIDVTISLADDLSPSFKVNSTKLALPIAALLYKPVLRPSDLTVEFSPSFKGRSIKFIGEMREFVYAASYDAVSKEIDLNQRIVSAAALDDAMPLSQMGVVELNDMGIVVDSKLKSCWANAPLISTIGDRTIKVESVSFWVTDGGRRWLDFRFDGSTICIRAEADWTEVSPPPVFGGRHNGHQSGWQQAANY